MSTKDIYFGTFGFVIKKFLLGLASILACVLFALIFIPLVTKIGMFSIILWIILSAAVYGILNRYLGYMIKVGHIAVISKAVVDGAIPENSWSYAVASVKKRFISANVYYVIDNLVSGAVKQINGVVDKADSLLGGIPGVSAVLSFAKMFINISLGYIDECCLAYTFFRPEENAFKCACDGVVIYFQNWKKLLKSAAVTALIVVGVTLLFSVVPFILFGLIISAIGFNFLYALIPAVLLGMSLKSAFLDSFILIRTMKSYMEVAPSTELKVDIYDKLCKLSSKFKSLFNKSSEPAQV